ncbi:MAG: HNH endonuclease [Mogibacterium sp.]|nr:HNH endonuclease [Mogibacterium sp.]
MMDISKASVDTIKETVPNKSAEKNFNPDERIKPETAIEAPDEKKEFNPDDRVKPEIKPNEDGFYTTEEERIKQTPKDGIRGAWDGERGNSKFIPAYQFIKERLAKYGEDGINYNKGVADFSKVSEGSVVIDNMTSERWGHGKNFEQCDEKFAEKFNKERKDGRTDWIARDVAEYIDEHNLTRHEEPDGKTMHLVDTEIHGYFNHSGGCKECSVRDNNKGGGFDA